MISEKIKALREHNNYTQDDLAFACNVTRSAVSNWENNRREPSHDMVRTIACIFGVTIEELLNDNISVEQILNGPTPSIVNDTNIDDDHTVVGNKRFISVVQKINVVLTLIVTICLLMVLIPAINKNRFSNINNNIIIENIETVTLQLRNKNETFDFDMAKAVESYEVIVDTQELFMSGKEYQYYYAQTIKVNILINGESRSSSVRLIENSDNCLKFNPFNSFDIKGLNTYLFVFYVEGRIPYFGAFIIE